MTHSSATATVISERSLKSEAARADVETGEYLARLRLGEFYCWRCRGWHEAEAFDPDSRRFGGRAGSCRQALRDARRAEILEKLNGGAAG
jgi:hypothetical protein